MSLCLTVLPSTNIFMCLAACATPTSTTIAHKLAPCSVACIFLGYPCDDHGYRRYDPSTGLILISRYVLFDESVFPFRILWLRHHPQIRSCLRWITTRRYLRRAHVARAPRHVACTPSIGARLASFCDALTCALVYRGSNFAVAPSTPAVDMFPAATGNSPHFSATVASHASAKDSLPAAAGTSTPCSSASTSDADSHTKSAATQPVGPVAPPSHLPICIACRAVLSALWFSQTPSTRTMYWQPLLAHHPLYRAWSVLHFVIPIGWPLWRLSVLL
jgi:hypothetical protein